MRHRIRKRKHQSLTPERQPPVSPYRHKITAYDDDDHEQRLAQLDLAASELLDAVLGGYMRGRDCTSNHPRIAPGFDTWSETVALLREIKRPDGWMKRSVRNYETVLHPQRVCAIAVAGGTYETGTDGTPHTRTPKGAVTKEAVVRNQQLTLFPAADVPETLEERPETWLLLHYYDHAKGEIRCELSLPLEMAERTITAWRERITLAPIPFAMDDPIDNDDDDDFDDDDPIDVDVPRRPH